MFKKADSQRVGLIGHSMGGFGVLKLAMREKFLEKYKVAAVVGVAPAVELDLLINPKRILIPTFYTTGTADTVVPPLGVIAAYNENPIKDKVLANGVGLTHNDIGYHGTEALNSYIVQYLRCKVS